MYMFIYTYVYIHTYIHTHAYVYIYIYIINVYRYIYKSRLVSSPSEFFFLSFVHHFLRKHRLWFIHDVA